MGQRQRNTIANTYAKTNVSKELLTCHLDRGKYNYD